MVILSWLSRAHASPPGARPNVIRGDASPARFLVAPREHRPTRDPRRHTRFEAAPRWFGALALVLLGGACTPSERVAVSGCERCHRPPDLEQGLEQQHPSFALACTHCHGGRAEATSVAEAHVPGPGDLKHLALREIEATDPAHRRFGNPTDLSAASATCGGEDGCHSAIVQSVRLSVHATLAGVVQVASAQAGIEPAGRAVVEVRDPRFAAGTPFTAEALPALGGPSPVDGTSTLRQLAEHTFAKACTGCHLGVYGAPGVGRSNNWHASGCAACHVPYAPDGLGQSGDPTANPAAPGHPLAHFVEHVAISDRQCESCHHTSLRVGTAFRGLRERTADDGPLPNARVEGAIHGQPAGFFIDDDDTRDTLDVTPADVHQQKGMVCIDCHVGQDVHGDGRLRTAMGAETGVECSDCHGTFDARAGVAEGELRTSGGATLKRVRREPDGSVILTGALDGLRRVVPQVVDLRENAALRWAHNTERHGELECYACHTAWMQNFYLIERTLDLRGASRDPLAGGPTPGEVREDNQVVRLDALHLGINADGKIGPLMAMNGLLSVIAPCDPRQEPEGCERSAEQPIFGRKILDRHLEADPQGRLPLAFVPAFPHTTSTRATVQACERCHPRDYEVNEARAAATYGFGSGRFFAPLAGTSTQADLSRYVDAEGRPIVTFGHPGTGPVPIDRIRKALEHRITLPLR